MGKDYKVKPGALLTDDLIILDRLQKQELPMDELLDFFDRVIEGGFRGQPIEAFVTATDAVIAYTEEIFGVDEDDEGNSESGS